MALNERAPIVNVYFTFLSFVEGVSDVSLLGSYGSLMVPETVLLWYTKRLKFISWAAQACHIWRGDLAVNARSLKTGLGYGLCVLGV